jgi:predicted outer membrane repeat protein
MPWRFTATPIRTVSRRTCGRGCGTSTASNSATGSGGSIRARVCAFDWRRTDRVEGNGGFADGYVRGIRSTDDIVYHILDEYCG